MSMMKTSLTIIPMCPRGRLPLYKSLSRLVLCYKKDWATLLHLVYFCYLLPVMNYLITKLFVTDNFSACREYLTENRLWVISTLSIFIFIFELIIISEFYHLLMTHKCRGSVVVLSISKSVEPNVEQKEMISSFH